MAIFHFNEKTGSRAKGQSAKAKLDYLLREGKYAADRKELFFHESGNMPGWAEKNPREFWKAVDIHERSNATLFRHFEISLPVELSEKEQLALAKKFAEEVVQDENGRMPFTLTHHHGKGKNGKGINRHFDLIVSERLIPLDPDATVPGPEIFFKDPRGGGCKKSRKYTDGTSRERKSGLIELRKKWAEMANEALRVSGHSSRIDHRSFVDQGITDDLPGLHIGVKAAALEEKGYKTAKGEKAAEVRKRRRRIRKIKKELFEIDKEIKQEEEDINGTNVNIGTGPNRAQERLREYRRGPRKIDQNADTTSTSRRIEEKVSAAGEGQLDRRGNQRDTENSQSTPNHRDNSDRDTDHGFSSSVFFNNLPSPHIVREANGDKAKWKEWREKILTERYGFEITHSSSFNHWKLKKRSDRLELQSWNDDNIKIIDRGDQIEANSGHEKEIEGMIDLAKLKKWSEILLEGDDDFVRAAMREAAKKGVKVSTKDEHQKKILETVEHFPKTKPSHFRSEFLKP